MWVGVTSDTSKEFPLMDWQLILCSFILSPWFLWWFCFEALRVQLLTKGMKMEFARESVYLFFIVFMLFIQLLVLALMFVLVLCLLEAGEPSTNILSDFYQSALKESKAALQTGVGDAVSSHIKAVGSKQEMAKV